MRDAKQRAQEFCQQYGLRAPILLAPMAGACPVSLSAAVANAGGMGACGALLMQPKEIIAWASEVRSQTAGPFQINLWIPDPPPPRDPVHEGRLRTFLARFGPEVSATAGDATLPDFDGQCDALLQVRPPMVSSVMGLYPPEFVKRLKSHGIKWCANVSTVAEAIQAQAAGADLVAAQGAEAGGHRGCFNPDDAERKLVGLFSLIPAVVDALRIPVIATGGIADARGIAAALTLGASAVQIGTGFLRCPEAKIPPAWADELARTAPEQTMLTRAFSGRAGRTIATSYVQAAASPEAPAPAPYPIQRALTAPMRADALNTSDVQRMQAWAGQSAAMALAEPAANLVEKWWRSARQMLP
jgi:nitronate monooxygenase